MKGITKLTMILSTAFLFQVVMAEETTAEKAGYVKDKTVDGAKKAGRAVKDAVCMKGDLECAAQKAGHGISNTADKTKTEVKKKINELDSE
jgi:hypothetical protein